MEVDTQFLENVAKALTEANLSIQLLAAGNVDAAEVERTLAQIHQARKQLLLVRKGVNLDD